MLVSHRIVQAAAREENLPLGHMPAVKFRFAPPQYVFCQRTMAVNWTQPPAYLRSFAHDAGMFFFTSTPVNGWPWRAPTFFAHAAI
jgi:hypothetical protein